jgi:hypothetical protein
MLCIAVPPSTARARAAVIDRLSSLRCSRAVIGHWIELTTAMFTDEPLTTAEADLAAVPTAVPGRI